MKPDTSPEAVKAFIDLYKQPEHWPESPTGKAAALLRALVEQQDATEAELREEIEDLKDVISVLEAKIDPTPRKTTGELRAELGL